MECVRLDDALAGAEVSFIKMDVEGAELDALEGARAIITSQRPVLALSAYHRQDHLWRIPQMIRGMSDDYHLVLRAHRLDGWETVCYAIPEERWRGQGRLAGTVVL